MLLIDKCVGRFVLVRLLTSSLPGSSDLLPHFALSLLLY